MLLVGCALMHWTGELPAISLGGREVLGKQSFRFDRGVSFLVGRNGAGKTTFLHSVLGLMAQRHHASSVLTLDSGESASSHDRRLFMGHVGYLPQDIPASRTLTCQQFVAHAGWLKGMAHQSLRPAVDAVLTTTNLSEHRRVRMDRLSGGMRRRAGLAAALVHDPELVFMDEPTAGLDPVERQHFHDHVTAIAAHTIVVFSTHLDDDVVNVDGAIVVLKKGHLERVTTSAADRPRVAELLARDP